MEEETTMDRPEMIGRIESALGEVLERPVDGLAEDTKLFDDLHLDSTSVLEVLMALEDSVGIDVDPDELDIADFESVGTLTDYVSRQAKEGDAPPEAGR